MKSKSIRILSILILLLSMVVLGDGFQGFKDGWNSAGRDLDKKPEGKIHRVEVALNPAVAYSLPDTLQLADNRKIPYQIGNIALGMKTDKVYELFSGIIGFVSAPGLSVPDCLGGIVFLPFYPGCATAADIHLSECQETPCYLLDVVVCRDYEEYVYRGGLFSAVKR